MQAATFVEESSKLKVTPSSEPAVEIKPAAKSATKKIAPTSAQLAEEWLRSRGEWRETKKTTYDLVTLSAEFVDSFGTRGFLKYQFRFPLNDPDKRARVIIGAAALLQRFVDNPTEVRRP
jgi:hypothetical protein